MRKYKNRFFKEKCRLSEFLAWVLSLFLEFWVFSALSFFSNVQKGSLFYDLSETAFAPTKENNKPPDQASYPKEGSCNGLPLEYAANRGYDHPTTRGYHQETYSCLHSMYPK